jgi:GxxExxY protein
MDDNTIGTKLMKALEPTEVIEDKVIAELKSVEIVSPANKKQTQTYLRLTENKLGYLLNFGGEVMKTSITRCVNGLPE